MKKILLLLLIMISTNVADSGTETINIKINKTESEYILIYNNIWGSIYNPVRRQCDNSPTLTGDGSKINPKKASNHRWIAISQDMLFDMNRAQLIDSTDKRFKGKLSYGDTVWIKSPNVKLNGWWVIHDSKNKSYTKSIDFLQTKGDESLYNNNPLWSGKFDNIKIYKLKTKNYFSYGNLCNNKPES